MGRSRHKDSTMQICILRGVDERIVPQLVTGVCNVLVVAERRWAVLELQSHHSVPNGCTDRFMADKSQLLFAL